MSAMRQPRLLPYIQSQSAAQVPRFRRCPLPGSSLALLVAQGEWPRPAGPTNKPRKIPPASRDRFPKTLLFRDFVDRPASAVTLTHSIHKSGPAQHPAKAGWHPESPPTVLGLKFPTIRVTGTPAHRPLPALPPAAAIFSNGISCGNETTGRQPTASSEPAHLSRSSLRLVRKRCTLDAKHRDHFLQSDFTG